MVSKVLSATPYGFQGQLIEIEGDLAKGLPSVQIVGLGNKAIDEARDRVRSAIKNSLLDFPKGKITINLAPAELPKDGAQFDLPIALTILQLGGHIKADNLQGALFAGELALDGSIRPIRSAITIAEVARAKGLSTVYLPKANADQALLVDGISAIPLTSLKELFLHLKGESKIPAAVKNTSPHITSVDAPPIDAISGQDQAKRAITIAVAGRHNILLSGPPGSGKTMLARTLNGLLPPLQGQEIIDATKLHMLGNSGEPLVDIITTRPFRAPHHTASRTSIIGGGPKAQPGEISLAHRGTLFLDELLEYPRTILEALRQPLEDRHVTISRAAGRYTYPAEFLLVATMNPCPCGYYGDNEKACSCSTSQIINYQKRLSGPFLDRIDMTINVARVPHESLLSNKPLKKTQQQKTQQQIARAIETQQRRYGSCDIYNSSLKNTDVDKCTTLSPDAKAFLLKAAKNLDLSARSYFKVIKVARTIADLEDSENITIPHLAESLQYRQVNLTMFA